MAYYNGQATSYTELLNVLVAACVAEGWTWADGILNKGTAYVAASYNPTASVTNGSGLQFQGGTGKSSGALVNPSPSKIRIGPLNAGSFVPAPSFPLDYHIFIFDNPDEVYLVIKYEIDRFFFAGFGLSTIPGNGLWLSGSTGLRYSTNTSNATGHFSIQAEAGGDSQSSVYARATGFFWQSFASGDLGSVCQIIFTEVDAIGWTGLNLTPANQKLAPLIAISPSSWTNETILLPIEPVLSRASSKVSILTKIENARYLRIDNLEPEQILTFGAEKWMVFPFHKKDISVRDGGSSIGHSGTFGWAIRYDGP
ncbi:hypothetical protein [Acinetobacter sp.]|uniref:hypothetical protein n=1 Tax=Acinetobacter sp. TaxID=472 RepID=UPI0028ACD30B|nr:hypothetical protein [Acinetobacter sp.]